MERHGMPDEGDCCAVEGFASDEREGEGEEQRPRERERKITRCARKRRENINQVNFTGRISPVFGDIEYREVTNTRREDLSCERICLSPSRDSLAIALRGARYPAPAALNVPYTVYGKYFPSLPSPSLLSRTRA